LSPARTSPAGVEVYGGAMADQEATPATPLLGQRFAEALTFAYDAHLHQPRKGGDIPYIGHLLGVCALVIEEGGNEDAAIAALLHDAVEDQGGQEMLDEIRGRFGDCVGDIVLACSDTLVMPKPPWHERKERYLAHLTETEDQVRLVSLADKLFNARAIKRDYEKDHEKLWDRFKGKRDPRTRERVRHDQLWYYTELSKTFTKLSGDVHMTKELAEVVDVLARECKDANQSTTAAA
jgi:(p)ppGpp synthase/HD superfamily hydrolase